MSFLKHFSPARPSSQSSPPRSLSLVRLALWASLALAMLASACEGCCCGPDCNVIIPDAGPAAALAFDGLPQSIDCLVDDADGDLSNGIQLEVDVVVSNDDGTIAQVEVSSSRTGDTATGVVTNGRATVTVDVEGGDAPGAENTITVSAEGADTITDTINVVCAQEEPTVSCQFDVPGDGDVITQSPTTVAVSCTAANAENAPDVQALADAGLVIVTVTGDAGGAGTPYEFPLVNGSSARNDVVMPADVGATLALELQDPQNLVPDAVDSIDVDIELPGGLVITSPLAGATFDEDGDGDANGITVPLTGSADSATDVSFVAVCSSDLDDPLAARTEASGSTTTGEVTLTGSGPVEFAADMANLGNGTCRVEVDVDGTVVEVEFVVAGDAPSFDVTLDPDGGGDGFFVVADDPTPGDGVLDVDATFTPVGDAAGLTATVSLVDPDGVATVLLTDQALDAPFTVAVDVPYSEAAGWALTIVATDGAGVAGPTFVVRFTLDTVAPTVVIDFPAENDTLTAGFDQSAAPGFQTAFSAAVSGVDNGASFAVVDALGDSVGQCTVSLGTCSGTLTLADGEHTITVTVSDNAGNTTTSAPVTFRVDGTAPAIASITIAEDADGNAIVNIAENGADNDNITSAVTITFAAAPADIEDDQTVTATARVNGVVVGSAVQGSADGVVNITALTLGQGVNVVTVTGTDTVGNPIEVATASITVLVDTVAPAIVISDPSDAVLNSGDDLDPNTPGLQVNVLVEGDEASADIDLLDGATVIETGSADNDGDIIFLSVTLAEGTRSLTATVTDAAGNATTSPGYAPLVDTVAPALSIADPANNDVLAQADDEDGNINNGLQYVVEVSTPDGVSGNIVITSNVEGVVGQGARTGNTTFITITLLLDGQQTLIASAVDDNGNAGASAPVNVTVDTGLYVVRFDSPDVVGGIVAIGPEDDAGDPGVQVIVVAEVIGAAPGTTCELRRNGATLAAGIATIGDFATFPPQQFADGQTGTMEAFCGDLTGKTGTTGLRNFEVDLGGPAVSFVTPSGPSATFNAASEQGAGAGAPGLQTVVTIAVSECEGGTIVVRDGADIIGQVTPSPALGAAATNVNVNINDPDEGNSEAWTATCTDRVGNVGNASLTATVDVTPPAAPPLTVTVLSIRRGQVRVQFQEPGDQGDGGGNVSQLQLVASRLAITTANFDSIAAINPPTPGGGGLLTATIVNAGTQRNVPANSLAFDNAWNFALRVRDDAGNDTFVTTQLALTDFDTTVSTVVHADGDSGLGGNIDDLFAGLAIGRGDLDGDGDDEVVATASGQGDDCAFGPCNGAVHIFAGGSDISVASSRVVAAPNGTSAFGTGAALADLDNDGNGDLIVTGYDEFFSEARVFVYYGTGAAGFVPDAPNAVLTSVIDFSGAPSFHDIAFPVGDVSADGFDDVLLAMSFFSGGNSLVLLRGGSTRLASGALAAAPTATTINIGSAGGGATGFLSTAAGAGLVDADAVGDFVVSTDGNVGAAVVNQHWTVRGRSVWPATIDLGAAGNALAPIPCAGDTCGSLSVTAGDVDGDGETDLVLPHVDRLKVHKGNGTAFSSTISFEILASDMRFPGAGGGTLGVVGDLNGDGAADCIVPRRVGGVGRFSVFFGHGGAGNRTTSDIDYTVAIGDLDPAAATGCGNVDGDILGIDEICLAVRSGAGGPLVLHR